MAPKLDRADVSADPVQVRKIVIFLLEAMTLYAKSEEFTLMDAFMGIHSFHKLNVMNTANRWESEGSTPAHQTIYMADVTWRTAMRDLKRRLAPLNRDTRVPASVQELIEILEADEGVAVDSPVSSPVVVDTRIAQVGVE